MSYDDIETLLTAVWDLGLGKHEDSPGVSRGANKETVDWYEKKYGILEEGFIGGPQVSNYTQGIEAILESLGPGKIVGIAGRPAAGKSYLSRMVAIQKPGCIIHDEDMVRPMGWKNMQTIADSCEGLIVPRLYLDDDAPITTRVYLETDHGRTILNAVKRMAVSQTPGLISPWFQKYLFYECDFQKACSDIIIRY